MVSEEDINAIKYFIIERGDITRYCRWDKIKEDVEKGHPVLIRALEKVIIAKKMLKLVVEDL